MLSLQCELATVWANPNCWRKIPHICYNFISFRQNRIKIFFPPILQRKTHIWLEVRCESVRGVVYMASVVRVSSKAIETHNSMTGCLSSSCTHVSFCFVLFFFFLVRLWFSSAVIAERMNVQLFGGKEKIIITRRRRRATEQERKNKSNCNV